MSLVSTASKNARVRGTPKLLKVDKVAVEVFFRALDSDVDNRLKLHDLTVRTASKRQ